MSATKRKPKTVRFEDCVAHGINMATVRYRVGTMGWDYQRALTTPTQAARSPKSTWEERIQKLTGKDPLTAITELRTKKVAVGVIADRLETSRQRIWAFCKEHNI